MNTLSSFNIDSAQSGAAPRCDQPSILRIWWSSPNLVQRILLLAFLFVAELIALSVWLDGASLIRRTGLIGIMGGDWGPWVLRCVVCFAAIFVTFAWVKNKAALERISDQVAETPIRWRFLAAHCFAMVVFAELSSVIFRAGGPGRADLFAASWFVAGISAITFAGFAFLSWAIWARLVRSTGHLWAYALMAAVSACVVGNLARWLWQPTSHLTFGLTEAFLRPFVSGMLTNPETMILGTQRFSVQIAPECSGLEGIGLILAFGVLWLLVFRRECRFPQSLVLLPLGVVLMFVLNAVRIAALVLIGDAGAQQIALGGFHSQAGWIAFSAVAVGFCWTAQQVPWFTKRQYSWESLAVTTENPSVAFLMPLLAILAAGMITGAFSAGFEWLYPLRFFAAAAMLWFFRRSYAGLSWRFDWRAAAIGAIVFVTWIGLDHFARPAADQGVPSTLLASSTEAKAIWITFRVLAAVITVPVAEELAFRGFLMRRLISPDFDFISFQRFTWFALLASSIVFGLLHGGNWLAGSVAGILFGLAAIRRGRIGDAVIAHATANALLATYVLTYHQWHFW